MKLNLYTNNMERQELFEFAASIAAKNMALEEEIKRLELQLDENVKIINAYNDHFEDDEDDDFDFDYDEEIRKEEENLNHSPSDDLSQKINAINARLNGTNSRLTEFVHTVTELEKRMSMSDLEYSELKSKVFKYLEDLHVGTLQNHYRVSDLEEKEDNDGK